MRKFATTLGGLLLTGSALVPSAATGTAAVDTCRGLPATSTGTPGQPMTGTPGNDVMVSNGATFVVALGGHDTVCATGGTGHVDAGEGDDVVDATAQSGVDTDLGGGADSFLGGPGYDDVRAAGVHDPAVGPVPDDDTDVIDTGAGDSRVQSGTPGLANADRITTGAGDASIALSGTPGAGDFLHLGVGTNVLVRDVALLPEREWFVAASGTTPVPPDSSLVDLTGRLAETTFIGRAPRGVSVAFLGTANADEVSAEMTGRPRVTLRLKSGDDRINLGCNSLAEASLVQGGAGRDRFTADFCRPARIDLRNSLLDLGQRTRGGAAGIVNSLEWVFVRSTRLTLIGSDKDEILRIDACAFRVRGRGGDDRLHFAPVVAPAPCGQTFILRGGSGDDLIQGSPYSDDILGDAGVDEADGSFGRDICLAEKTIRCEVTS